MINHSRSPALRVQLRKKLYDLEDPFVRKPKYPCRKTASAALDDDLINSSVKVVGNDGIGIPRAFAAVVAETFLTSGRINFRIIVLLV